MKVDMTECQICGGADHSSIHDGPIRDGKFGTLTAESQHVYRCSQCGVARLEWPRLGESYYEGAEYRMDVNASSSAADYYKQHDGEQARNIALTGTARFRGRLVADIGCGAGSYLDSISGFAETAIAIEPSIEYQEELRKKGYPTFSYATDAAGEYGGRVDIVVCFSVIEHIEEPVPFLQAIRTLLRPGGVCLLTTPNLNDCLLKAGPANYPSFFFRKVHRWYFDQQALATAFRQAGFSASEVRGHHRFGLSNLLGWLKNQRPSGDGSLDLVTPAIDAVWKSELERTLTCDYLFATATA